MNPLTESEFKATFGDAMTRLGADDVPPVDFWPYFEAIPEAEKGGHHFTAGKVEWVYQDSLGKYQHILINSGNRNVFMVIVLDCQAMRVFGHRILDLNQEYGLTDSP